MSDRDMNDLDKLKAQSLVFPQMFNEIENLMDEYETKSLNSKENYFEGVVDGLNKAWKILDKKLREVHGINKN
tara:strand:- start:2082 stop:2300 length:219 start_codon:yes stop_codon:yes gene_type:complete